MLLNLILNLWQSSFLSWPVEIVADCFLLSPAVGAAEWVSYSENGTRKMHWPLLKTEKWLALLKYISSQHFQVACETNLKMYIIHISDWLTLIWH